MVLGMDGEWLTLSRAQLHSGRVRAFLRTHFWPAATEPPVAFRKGLFFALRLLGLGSFWTSSSFRSRRLLVIVFYSSLYLLYNRRSRISHSVELETQQIHKAGANNGFTLTQQVQVPF